MKTSFDVDSIIEVLLRGLIKRDAGPVIRIFIANEHDVIRKRLKQIISEAPDLVVVAEASNGHEVMEKIYNNEYDMVILDIGTLLNIKIPGRSGIDILKAIKRYRPQLPVLVLSMYPEEQYAVQVLKTGASGYLITECATNKLITAIREISEGKKYVSPFLSEKMRT